MPLSAAPSTASSPRPQMAPVTLVARLGDALRESGLAYCQWKGHGKRERWASGLGDIDLLVDRAGWDTFARLLAGLGFKLATQTGDPPGMLHYYGLDEWTGRLVHVHAHTQLVVGAPGWAAYRLPLERALLGSAMHRTVFATPAPELEAIVLLISTVLRISPAHAARRGTPAFLVRALSELERLEELGSPAALQAALRGHLPEVGPDLFRRCREALAEHCPRARRFATRVALATALAPHLCRPPGLAAARRALRLVFPERRGLAGGGAVVALLGGDGAGKSTCAAALRSWLRGDLATMHVHLGKPPRSPVTLAFGAALKAGRALGLPRRAVAHLELLRCLGTARDRYAVYRRARRFAARGGIAVCERYPVPENWALAGPSEAQGAARDAASPLAARLRRWERAYYDRITRPDLAFVLLLDGERAVDRKPGEPADYVRQRATLTRTADWTGSGAVMIDAAQPLPQVLAALKGEIWRAL